MRALVSTNNGVRGSFYYCFLLMWMLVDAFETNDRLTCWVDVTRDARQKGQTRSQAETTMLALCEHKVGLF